MKINRIKKQLEDIDAEIEADRRELQRCYKALKDMGIFDPAEVEKIKESYIRDIEELSIRGHKFEEQIESLIDDILQGSSGGEKN